jgi:hypothetical protein
MKVKKEFLEKVFTKKIVYTKNYQYKAFKYTAVNEKEEFYDFFIVKRIDINYVDTTRYLEEIFWESIAQTTDGKTFTRF